MCSSLIAGFSFLGSPLAGGHCCYCFFFIRSRPLTISNIYNFLLVYNICLFLSLPLSLCLFLSLSLFFSLSLSLSIYIYHIITLCYIIIVGPPSQEKQRLCNHNFKMSAFIWNLVFVHILKLWLYMLF